MKSNTRIGQWTLEDELGSGGNAIVWRARRDDGLRAALKVLRTRRRDREAFRRFRDEIAVLERLGSHPGVLPLIDADLPDDPRNPAWLAMPEAVTTRTALEQAPADIVVAAVAMFAETLADLERLGIAHRDIKPENLYRYEGRWLIGDFGLVEYPAKDPVTRPGQRFGPNHFVAPEVVADAATAEGAPSDLYSLAKTLWVLLTGQRWPPPVEHRLDRPEYLVTTYLSGDRVRLLDPVIARATRHNPAERQTTENFARQLHVWLSPGKDDAPDPPTLTDLGERIANYDAERLERTRVFQDVAPRFDNAFYELKNRLDRVHRAISEAIPTGLGYSDNPSLLIELDVRQQLVHTVSFASVHSADTDRANLGALLFYAGIAGGLSEDDRGVLGAIYMIQDNRRKEIPWRDVRRFEVDAPDQPRPSTL